MGSSAAMSIRTSNRRAIRPPFAQLVTAHMSQTRSMWRCARDSQGKNSERISRFYKDKRYPLYNQRKDETQHDAPATSNPLYSSRRWATWYWNSSSPSPSADPERRSLDSDSGYMQKHMELLRKSIEADPYSALFGRRSNYFNSFGKCDNSSNGFLQSFSSTKKPANTISKRVGKRQTKGDANHAGLQYDPISGRMIPITPLTGSASSSTEKARNSQKVKECPPGTEVEAKFASNPSLIGKGQFQPGSMAPDPRTPSKSQPTIDCPPGSELETLFSSIPVTSEDTHVSTPISQTSERKPNINIDCSPGNELESLFVSESFPSKKPQSDTFKMNETTNRLNLDAGLSTGTNVECSPGSELEAKFASDPASRFVESSPSELVSQSSNRQMGISVDCPPGNELDVKLSSELASSVTKSSGTIHDHINKSTQALPKDQALSPKTVECSPGSEIEARILFRSASQGAPESKAQTPVNCPPGSELEAKFICNEDSVEEKLSQPEMPSSLGNLPKAKIAIDCTPGNELEAKFVSDKASAKILHDNEDLGALDADEIRSRYTTSESDVKPRALDFDGSEDRVGDTILQAQKLAAENTEQASISHEASPRFHILAFDTSTSQISATQADSFFGIEEDARPNEVLSRLHNPSKFLPYFQKMQEDGYEIVTGGGNILIFRKIQSNPSHISPSNAATHPNPSFHADVAKYLRHDAVDPARSYPRASKSPSTEPSTTGASNFEPESTKRSGSPFRKAGRRMLMAGTVTAATCYAIGVVTEFFRTGGTDGRGIDGLTAFESDRRHRE